MRVRTSCPLWLRGGFILAKTIQAGLHELTGKSDSSTILWLSGSDLAYKGIAGHLRSTEHYKKYCLLSGTRN